MYEVEMKFRVDDSAALKATLAELGCMPDSACEEFDRFFQHPSRDFVQTDECLRIRRRTLADGGVEQSLTYKGPKVDTATKTRREIEMPIDGSPQWFELLEALGFHEKATVRKQRRYGSLTFNGQHVEVLLDFLPDLDEHFVELEAIAEENEVAEKRRLVLDLAAKLGLTESIRTSYLGLVSEKK